MGFSEIESRYEGNLHIFAEELNSGKQWLHREDKLVATASTIKFPILIYACMQVHKQKLEWESPIKLLEQDKVGGMGVLRHFMTPRQLTLHDACYLMTTVSDNTATNLVIDLLGKDAINDFIAEMGLSHTRLNRKAFSPDNEESKVYGLGVSSAKDMATLLREVYRPSVLPPEVANKVQYFLALQQDLVGIARVLPHGWLYGGKTGRVMDVRGDVGYVKSTDGREWILSMFCYGLKTENWSIQNEGLLSIADATRFILFQDQG